ncbi:hypothetical protein KUTeg_005224 [Tegillarca granosa]|uniref:Uncharacterized protein n=1 Tax=Tegillarca granosa TaxID=220873 RepID=A0ABQ9FM16_TEGGR|nr:hypothetical protein KUTeg_005224 [Tegillarca granosa]
MVTFYSVVCVVFVKVKPRSQELGHFYWVVCVVFTDRLSQELGYFLLGCLCGLYRQVKPKTWLLFTRLQVKPRTCLFYWVVCVVFIDRLSQELGYFLLGCLCGLYRQVKPRIWSLLLGYLCGLYRQVKPRIWSLFTWLFVVFIDRLSQEHGHFLLGCLCGLFRQVKPRNQEYGHFYWVVCVVFIDRLSLEYGHFLLVSLDLLLYSFI